MTETIFRDRLGTVAFYLGGSDLADAIEGGFADDGDDGLTEAIPAARFRDGEENNSVAAIRLTRVWRSLLGKK